MIGGKGDARQQELLVQIRLGLITLYYKVWTLYPRNVKTYYRSIIYHLDPASEIRSRQAEIHRAIGFCR